MIPNILISNNKNKVKKTNQKTAFNKLGGLLIFQQVTMRTGHSIKNLLAPPLNFVRDVAKK